LITGAFSIGDVNGASTTALFVAAIIVIAIFLYILRRKQT
jgi:hypothetical protein